MNESSTFFSSNTKKRYWRINHDPNVSILDCKSTNVIYLLTCQSCTIQYVGETCQPKLSDRISKHRPCTESIVKEPGCRYVKEHFTSGPCKDALFSVHIIEKLQGNGRNENGELNEEVTEYRRKREHWWINELRTSYPYGLNIRVGSKLCNEENKSFDTYKQFHSSKSPSKKRRRGKFKPRSLRNARTEPSDVLTFLKSLLHDDLNVERTPYFTNFT